MKTFHTEKHQQNNFLDFLLKLLINKQLNLANKRTPRMDNQFLPLKSWNSWEIISSLSGLNYIMILLTLTISWLVWVLLMKKKEFMKGITDEEMKEKLLNWHPEPLVPNVADNPARKPRLVSTKDAKRLIVDGNDCLNIGTHNYLNFLRDKRMDDVAEEAVKKYGVGSCGPRGFYGTVDIHLELETKLAEFMDTEEAIVYSYGFSAVSSALAAYCKRKDIVFVDEKVNFAIQKGLNASRCQFKTFKHNDVEDFERLLIEQDKWDQKNVKKAGKIRRFLIVEGIYANTGLICPLPELVRLCRQYKLRIFIDESVSIGTLGDHGRGVTEHFNVPRSDVDMIIGSLEWAVGSIGGFCVGSSFVIEHQRLSGLGYCFSASLPPLLTAAAIKSFEIMEEDALLLSKLKENCRYFQTKLSQLSHFSFSADPQSPVKHLYLKKQLDHQQEEKLLHLISDKCIESQLAIVPSAYLPSEQNPPRSSLRVCVSSALSKDDIDFAFNVIEKSSSDVLSS